MLSEKVSAAKRILLGTNRTVLVVIGAITLHYMLMGLCPYFLQDSFYLFTAGKNPDAWNLSYISHIFSKSIANGVQYRPLSYYLWFAVVEPILGHNVYLYHMLSFGILMVLLLALFRWLESYFSNPSLNALFVLFVGLHSYTFYFTTVHPYTLKYFFPLLCFLILDSFRKKLAEGRGIFWGVILVSLSIMCHEGAAVFPAILLLNNIINRRRMKKTFYLILFPSIAYFILRFYIWEIPSDGFMSPDFNVHSRFGNYIGNFITVTLFSHNLGYENLTPWLSVAFLILLLFFTIRGNGQRERIYALVAFFMALIPFIILKNHLYPNRSFWAAVFLVLFLQSIMKNIAMKRYVVYLLAAMIFVKGILANYFLIDEISEKRGKLQEPTNKCLDSLVRGQGTFVTLNYGKQSSWVNDTVIPSYLAFRYTDKTFLIRSESLFYFENVIVTNGTYYRQDIGSNRWSDSYQYPSPRPYFKDSQEGIDISDCIIRRFY